MLTPKQRGELLDAIGWLYGTGPTSGRFNAIWSTPGEMLVMIEQVLSGGSAEHTEVHKCACGLLLAPGLPLPYTARDGSVHDLAVCDGPETPVCDGRAFWEGFSVPCGLSAGHEGEHRGMKDITGWPGPGQPARMATPDVEREPTMAQTWDRLNAEGRLELPPEFKSESPWDAETREAIKTRIEEFIDDLFPCADPHDDEAFLVYDILAVLEGKGVPSRDGSPGVGSAETTVTFPPSHRWYVDALYGPFDWDSANQAADLIMEGLLKLDTSDDSQPVDTSRPDGP